MLLAPIPDNDIRRLRALHDFQILDTMAEKELDDLVELAATICGTPISLVSLVDETRQWFKARYGLEARETGRDISFCGHAIHSEKIFEVEDASNDARFADNPLVTGAPFIRFYAGKPLITPEGFAIGTLCVIDTRPRKLDENQNKALSILASSVMQRLLVISSLKRNEEIKQQLFEYSAFRNSLLSALPVGIFRTDADGKCVFVNDRWSRLTGLSLEQAMDAGWSDALHPDDRDRVFSEWRDGAQSGTPFESEYRFRQPNGRVVWVHGVASAIFDQDGAVIGHVGSVTDITARKATDDALRSSENWLRAVLDNVVDGIITINAVGTIQSVNPATLRIFGYDVEEIVGRNVNILMPEPHRTQHDGYLQSYLTTGHARVIGIGQEVEGRTKSGALFPMELMVTEALLSGERMFVGVIRDVSERKKVERAKSEFISTVSHELRTPLTAIRGSLSLVNTGVLGELPDDVREMTEVAEESAIRLVRLINDILDIEKIGSGQLKLVLEPLVLADVLKRTVVDNRPYADQFGVGLTLAPPTEGIRVSADADRLLQVFTNLASNAIKFSPKGEAVTIAASESSDGWVRVSVSDHGPGIPEEFRPRIFGRFAQADASDSKTKGGTGLGLSICKGLVERMGGRISFDSVPGRGTSFNVELPVVGTEERARDAMLVVSADDKLSQSLGSMIEADGGQPITAETASDAKKILSENPIAAIILDVKFGQDLGADLLESLRKEGDKATIPVVVVSAHPGKNDSEVFGCAFSVVDWMTGPGDNNRLLSAVRRGVGTGSGRPVILHVEDDSPTRALVAKLVAVDADVVGAATVAEGLRQARDRPFDLAILDIGLPDGDGLIVTEHLKNHDGQTPPVIVFSGRDSPPTNRSDKITATLVKSLATDRELVETVRQLIRIGWTQRRASLATGGEDKT